jgi:hypothetical protein
MNIHTRYWNFTNQSLSISQGMIMEEGHLSQSSPSWPVADIRFLDTGTVANLSESREWCLSEESYQALLVYAVWLSSTIQCLVGQLHDNL